MKSKAKEKILVVSGAFSYNGHNQTRNIIWTAEGKKLFQELEFTGMYSTYTADKTLQSELKRMFKGYGDDTEFMYLPTTSDGYLRDYDDAFLDKSYLLRLPKEINGGACTYVQYLNEWKDGSEVVLKGRKSSGSKEVFFGIENVDKFEKSSDFIIQKKLEGKEYLFDCVNTGSKIVFTARENVSIVNGRDKAVRFIDFGNDLPVIFSMQKILSILDNEFELPTFFNVQAIYSKGSLQIIEIDSRYSGTFGCTALYSRFIKMGLTKSVEEGLPNGTKYFFIKNSLNEECQDATWKIEVIYD